MILIFFLEMLQRFLGLLEDVLPPRGQLRAEVLALTLIHERLFIGRPVVLGFGQHPTYSLTSFVFRRGVSPAPRGRLIYGHRRADNIQVRPGSPKDLNDGSMTSGNFGP